LIGKIILNGAQEKMMMVGITGTKGKSTVVSILSFVLKALDIKYASYSTLETSNNQNSVFNTQKMTMPGR
jgi:UDP-N-acetylmuramyl tripeptide synthase